MPSNLVLVSSIANHLLEATAATATQAARMFCHDAAEKFAPAALAAPDPYFSISNIDAPRGAVEWRNRPSQRIFARGERVYHGKQNDHRRLTPRGNQGGGLAGQSRRGV